MPSLRLLLLKYTCVSACLGLLTAGAVNEARAATTITYQGRILQPHTGNGVPRVTKLRFKLSGELPAQGACTKNFAIVSVSDGAYTLKQLLAMGFKQDPASFAEICSDMQTGALSETLYVNLLYYSAGNVQAAYTWQSFDPRQQRSADSVTLYANIEYHLSETSRPGRLKSEPGT